MAEDERCASRTSTARWLAISAAFTINPLRIGDSSRSSGDWGVRLPVGLVRREDLGKAVAQDAARLVAQVTRIRVG